MNLELIYQERSDFFRTVSSVIGIMLQAKRLTSGCFRKTRRSAPDRASPIGKWRRGVVPSFERRVVMEAANTNSVPHVPWNNDKIKGQESPLKLKENWAIRIRLQLGAKPVI